jgi:hypothetical protein
MNRRRKVRTSGKTTRFQVFVQFLLDSQGTSVSNMANGIGNVFGTECIMYDPRCSKFSNFTERRIVKLALDCLIHRVRVSQT